MDLIIFDEFIPISIHAPREGGDLQDRRPFLRQKGFQSTPPARGATAERRDPGLHQHISIHAPREGGDKTITSVDRSANISIHAPREGGDFGCSVK